MIPVAVPLPIVEATLEELQAAGQQGSERLVLWLGSRAQGQVVRLLVPAQETGVDYFRVDGSTMREIIRALAIDRLSILAQVHSHPGEAFHSRADDRWALVRHLGALSIVVPHFAVGITAPAFLNESAVFALDRDDRWLEVAHENLSARLRVEALNAR